MILFFTIDNSLYFYLTSTLMKIKHLPVLAKLNVPVSVHCGSCIWPGLELPESSSFSRGPMSSRWVWIYWLMCEVHWSHWWSLRRSCTVDSRSTVVRGLQRGSPGSRLLGMPRIWRSRNATWEIQRHNFIALLNLLQIKKKCVWNFRHLSGIAKKNNLLLFST